MNASNYLYWTIGSSIAAGVIGAASGYWLGHDNYLEQAAETYIYSQTGKKVDLSP